MKINVNDLEEDGLSAESEENMAPLIPELRSPVRVKAYFVKTDEGVHASYEVSAKLGFTCDKCLEPFEKDIQARGATDFVRKGVSKPPAGQELSPDEADTVEFSGDTVEVNDEIRQTVLLAFPARVVCGRDCRVLCPGCGKNLNSGACGCALNAASAMSIKLEEALKKARR